MTPAPTYKHSWDSTARPGRDSAVRSHFRKVADTARIGQRRIITETESQSRFLSACPANISESRESHLRTRELCQFQLDANRAPFTRRPPCSSRQHESSLQD